MAWSGRTLLTGSSEGVVQIYDIEATQLQEARTALGAVRSVGKLSHKLGKPIVSAPGTHIQSTRVNQLDLSPGHANPQVATTIGTSVHLWDLERTDSPIRSDKVAHEMNLALQWHPQSSYGLLASAGLDRNVSILDPRKQGKPMVGPRNWHTRTMISLTGYTESTIPPLFPLTILYPPPLRSGRQDRLMLGPFVMSPGIPISPTGYSVQVGPLFP